MSKAEYKRYDCVGPGGRKCSCCYPAPGKARNLYERKVKRTERQIARKQIFMDLIEIKELQGIPE